MIIPGYFLGIFPKIEAARLFRTILAQNLADIPSPFGVFSGVLIWDSH